MSNLVVKNDIWVKTVKHTKRIRKECLMITEHKIDIDGEQRYANIRRNYL